MVVPLAIVAVVIAHVPLSAYGNPDAQAFVARSLRIAHEWTAVVDVKDPPLRYAPLALVYTLADPSRPLAEAIAIVYGTLAVFVVTPLAVWACVRFITTPRVALLTVAAILANWLFTITLWPITKTAWQYYLAVPWVFATLAAAHWALGAHDAPTRHRRAIVTGALVGIVGLIQVFFAAVAAAIVAVAFALRRRGRALAAAGLTGGLFAGYYLVSAAACRQAFGGTARRMAAEPLAPITLREVALIAVVVLTLLLWLRAGRLSDRGVIEAALVVAGPLWIGAALASAGYLTIFAPILTYPLVAAAAVAGVTAIFDGHVSPRTAPDALGDGGARPALPIVAALPRWVFVSSVGVLALALTAELLARVPPHYPTF